MQPRTLKAIALMLHYPDQDLLDHLADLQLITDAEIGFKPTRLDPLYQYLGNADLYLLEENYVALFDRGRGTSLYLFEHVHGESRDRGQAMVDLLTMYGESGFDLSTTELPDYLPAFLEYLSLLPADKSKQLLMEVTHLVRNIGANLAKRGSHYYLLCSALLELAGEEPIDIEFVPMDFSTEQEDYDKLDKTWAEEPVTFGGGCSTPAYDGKTGEAVIQFMPNESGQKVSTTQALGA
jgi:nitrate reductase delta subunit